MGAWTAVFRNRTSIVTVLADTADEARKRIVAELTKPGRDAYLRRWVQDGQLVVQREAPHA